MSLSFSSSVPRVPQRRTDRRTVSLTRAQYAELSALAKEDGLSLSRFVARRLGLSEAPSPRGGSTRRYPPEIRRKAMELYIDGLSLHAAGAACGVTGSTVRGWLIAAGIPRRSHGGSRR